MKMENIVEMIKRDRVVRKGQWKIKYTTNQEGYKIVNKNGMRKEVKMPYTEIKKRKLASKKAARKRAGKMASINAKRIRSLNKRG